MGLVKGLSPILDLLVDKYFTIPDPQNPDGAMTRLREGKIAREVSFICEFINIQIIVTTVLLTAFQITRFESKLNLQHEQRAHFTNMYAETTTHIISENFRQYPVTFGLQKDSMFTNKFGKIMRYWL